MTEVQIKGTERRKRVLGFLYKANKPKQLGVFLRINQTQNLSESEDFLVFLFFFVEGSKKEIKRTKRERNEGKDSKRKQKAK